MARSLAALPVLPLMLIVIPEVTSACDTVRHAMDLRACLKIHVQGAAEVRLEQRGSIVETSLDVDLLGLMADPQHVCSQKQSFLKLFDCIAGVNAKCTKEKERVYFSDSTLTGQGLDYFCSNMKDIIVECYNESYQNVYLCVKVVSAEHVKPTDTDAYKACTIADITHDCIHTNTQCDEKTQDLLLKFQDVYRKPPACLNPARADRKKYISVTGGGNVECALVSKLFCFCLSFIFILLQKG